jgi:hypothetical protein
MCRPCCSGHAQAYAVPPLRILCHTSVHFAAFQVVDLLEQMQKETGVKLLWGTR